MTLLRPRATASILVVVDLQTRFLASVPERDRILAKAAFLIQTARLLGVPVVVTEQVPHKMGTTAHEISALLDVPPIAKSSFGCCEEPRFIETLEATDRREVVLVGVETHICIAQTAVGLLAQGYDVAVCPDGVGARSHGRHELGMQRIRDAGAAPIDTEGVVYEWLETADHPRFREALELVKRSATDLE
jgi:nicotinamidase-related amidase